MSKATLDDLKTRRSYRSFKSDQVSEADLDAILEAGTWAPTGAGSQSPVIVAVLDKAVVAQLEKLNAAVLKNPDAKPFYGGPVAVAVLVDTSKPTPLEDGALVLGNILNAAHAVGLGGIWIHRAKEVFESAEGKALLKKWGLSENLRGVGFAIIGHPAVAAPVPKPRKPDYIIKIK